MNRQTPLRAELLSAFQYATEADLDAQIDMLLAEVLEDDPIAEPLLLHPDDQNEDARVVITGIGVISPFGVGVDTLWEGLAAGRSVVERITHFDPSAFPCQVAGQVPNFMPQAFMDAKEARRMSRASQFAVAAARMAVEAAGLRIDAGNRDEIGSLIASSTTSPRRRAGRDHYGRARPDENQPLLHPHRRAEHAFQPGGHPDGPARLHLGDQHRLRRQLPGHRRGRRGDPPRRC